MDHMDLAQALSSDLESEKIAQAFQGMSIDELADFIKSDKPGEKDLSGQEKFSMADRWGRELAQKAKFAFSVTREGHEYDADRAAIRGEAAAKKVELSQRHHAMGSNKRTGNLIRALRFGVEPYEEPRHEAYVERKHREGKNAWNPFGGTMTPTKYEPDGSTLQYGEHETGHKFTSKDSRPKKKESAVIPLAKIAAGPGMLGSLAGRAMTMATQTPLARRALVGAGVGAAGGAAKHLMSADPNSSLVGNMAAGAGLGAVGGAGAKATATRLGGMNNAIGRTLGGAATRAAKMTGNSKALATAGDMALQRGVKQQAAVAARRAKAATP